MSENDVIVLNPLLHYRKVDLAGPDVQDNKTQTPVQIIFPTGAYGIGISTLRTDGGGQNNGEPSMIMSSPGESPADKYDLRLIKMVFITAAAINLIITALMYSGADKADPSNVSNYNNEVVSVFDKPSHLRPEIQNINFGFYIFLLLFACFSVMIQSPLGISIYAVAISLNFLLCMSVLPYYLFSLRYLLDMVMLYLALIYRSRITYSFIPTHVFDLRNRLNTRQRQQQQQQQRQRPHQN